MASRSERLKRIKSLVDSTGYIPTSDIAIQLNVSPMTIRRDLNDLNNQKQIIKVYGGAQSVTNSVSEYTTDEKMNKNVLEKKDIAKKLVELIPDNSTIFLGAGTTLLYAVLALKDKDLTFITNSLPAFSELNKVNCHVILSGGELYKNTSEFLGPIAERVFDGINIDIALASTNGIINDQVTTNNSQEGGIQNTAFQHANKTVIVADHTKLDKSDTFTFRKLSEFDYLVTDSNIDKQLLDKYSKYTKIIH
ncbi:DeoR/GlpR family DNA-binding transcription regulator [Pediococcus cellicola]|uniref:Lactose phosphotransferase system repressor n=1 Tax=Pediococcus cellicola TaxID=319652 RepID=A0A0R2IJK6_9LACO|nr:DeoR/GlpR family DNA-binding transcription regulator [Pediococcus cellicola]KRN65032.1 lactose transport regulator [Pediococcus cellicola]GEL15881.1 DeoR family transcriptional regulator [Pediococcus cellicola]